MNKDLLPTPLMPNRYLMDPAELADRGVLDPDAMRAVTEEFAFRTNDYYAGLIDWSDPRDPIRKLIVPSLEELDDFGLLDASDEAANTQVRGVQHKYADTVLMLVTDQCAGFCRYCFRKRLFRPGSREANRDISRGLDYVRSQHQVTDVLLTGGDPLTLPTARLAKILTALREIPHVHTIRIGSKLPAFNPYRILDDAELLALLSAPAANDSQVYLMSHFDHPRELTAPALEAIRLLTKSGVSCLNQCPLTAGVNDDALVLAELLQACTDASCPQYYVFQCRPTSGNRAFSVPLVRGFSLFSRARSRLSGISRRARYCLSHATGKIEVVGIDGARVYARYHRAKDPRDEGRMLVLRRDDRAYWLDGPEAAPEGLRETA